ncbi:MAG: class I SAM-dependent methyltransferase [Candidatus Eisenbacteria bacterium]
MDAQLEQEIASSLDATPELLPLLPALFEGLDDLGSSPDTLITVLRSFAAELKGAHVLDLGCGTGAVSVALAKALDARVLGVDGFAPLLEQARRRATTAGVSDRVTFRCSDLRPMLQAEGRFDAVTWMAMGTLLGDLQETVRQLRRVVRVGGLVMIEHEARAPQGGVMPDVAPLRAMLTAHGDELVREVSVPAWQAREAEMARATRLRTNAEKLAEADPFQAASVLLYLERRTAGAARLANESHAHLWVLRRK